jgi:putative ABC transport system permease protein
MFGKLIYLLKINFRNLFAVRRFAFVNIIGLSIGLTVSLLILLYIRFETSFENFNPNAKDIYRVVTLNFQDGSIGASTPLALSDVLKRDFPEIDKVVGLMRTWGDLILNNERFVNLKGAVVEKDFFGMFNIPLRSGNPNTIFQSPFEAVVTTKMAAQMFGKDDPIGKTFEYENFTFTVAGLINPIPTNSILDFDYFLSDGFKYKYFTDLSERWYHFGLFTFITFKGGRSPEGFDNKLSGIEGRYYPDFMKNRHKFLIAEFKGSHLNPSLQGDLKTAVSPRYLWLLSFIALAVLVIACLNFMNITIADAARRSVETGIKKVNGASATTLIREFFTESALTVCLSLIISIYLVYLLLPNFNNLIEKTITFSLSDPILISGVIGFGILTALFSGLYPSIVLSRPSPMRVLLHNREGGKNKLTFQKSFIVLQYLITIILAITLFFIFKQISFMQKHDTGFDRSNLIAIPVNYLGNNGNERLNNSKIFIQDLESYESQYGYGKASLTEFVPGFGFRNLFKIYPEGNQFPDGFELLSCDVDDNFLDVFGLHIIQGRFFSKDYSTDYNDAVIINESAFKKLGWNSIEGKNVGLILKDNRKKVIGIINDINIESLQNPIGPMLYQFGRHHNYPGYITLRLNTDRKDESIELLNQRWSSLFPEIPFSFESIDDKYKAAYGEEKKLAKITGIFSILALLLSLLGIFALSAMESDKRIKEIGIRKINGAKVAEIISLLNFDIVKWILFSFLIAVPVALIIVSKWLQTFAYRTHIDWWIFAIIGIHVIVIALLTVSYQSWKAATRNPVEALRYE